ncbi:hypothetical protein ERD95_19650 [Enterobacteriaceae bacterium ML5]|nr:hypothetical protein ERD95_19650 [Enterobacteriaceae bacterium ML5]
MNSNLLSEDLQKYILNALSIFHPDSMTARQYFDWFGDCDEFTILANVEALIRKGLVDKQAIRTCDGERFLSLGHLKLESATDEQTV